MYFQIIDYLNWKKDTDKTYGKRHRFPATLRILLDLCKGRIDISHWRRALPRATAGGPALYMLTAGGQKLTRPNLQPPTPGLSFVLALQDLRKARID